MTCVGQMTKTEKEMSECVVNYESVALCISFLPYLWQHLGKCIFLSHTQCMRALLCAVYSRLFLYICRPTLSTNLNFLVLQHTPCPGKAAAGWPEGLGMDSGGPCVPHRRCPCYLGCPDRATSGVDTGRSQASGCEEGLRLNWGNPLLQMPGWPSTGPDIRHRQYSGTWRAVHAAVWSKMLKRTAFVWKQTIQHWSIKKGTKHDDFKVNNKRK